MQKWIVVVLSALVAACSSGSGEAPLGPDRMLEPGREVPVEAPAEVQSAWQELREELDGVKSLDAKGFAARHAIDFEELSFDPLAAGNLALIQASGLALDEAEMNLLASNGFSISERRSFPSFVYGYETIYMEDLPVYVSADSILHAVHRSYDEILKAIETEALVPELRRMLGGMRASLQAGGASALGTQARKNADFYTAVALSLLDGTDVAPVAGADAGAIRSFVEGARKASGQKRIEIFGVGRNVDFSQFKPRGHYTDSAELARYFRAMMWLGRIDFRLIETREDGSQLFHRRQLEGALALRAILDEEARRSWARVDRTVGAFVGEPDNMTLPELDALLADLGTDVAGISSLPDEKVATAIVQGGYGTQRISSHIMINGLGEGTMPLSSTFLLLGQRYVVDSHVFSNVVYDRVQGGKVKRMMPDPLDVAFAALGNDHAGLLLGDELERFGYASDLESMRLLVDAHGEEFWNANLYNLWMGALRELSNRDAAALPEVARTEAWGRRLLNTQLASWAELRHDTILYAKQSYTSGAACEFPDAYVEPNPAFFAAIGKLAAHGEGIVAGLELDTSAWLSQRIVAYFQRLAEVSSILEEMATHQRDGLPHTEEHLAFINRAVKIQWGCGDPMGAEGWYADLFFDAAEGVEFDPTIADVHTQPTDEVGNMVGKVLHVATGKPRLAVITVDTCVGPRAYAGLVSSYFERVTENFERLDDPTWADELDKTTPPDVRWMQDLVAR